MRPPSLAQKDCLGTLVFPAIEAALNEVAAEVQAHCQNGGRYGWIKGWGRQAHQWTQLGLVIQDCEVPFLEGAMPRTLALLRNLSLDDAVRKRVQLPSPDRAAGQENPANSNGEVRSTYDPQQEGRRENVR